jgi:SAM-dependent methyltransferase
MHEFNTEDRAKFFNTVFPDLEREEMAGQKLRSRDMLTLRIVDSSQVPNSRILDFGCGQGRLLAHLVKSGFNAYGMEVHQGMRDAAVAELAKIGEGDRLFAGGIDELSQFPEGSYSHVITMGVMQYLSDEEYSRAVDAIARLLQPGGKWIVTFQNALFDLYTFNKYTVDHYMNELIGPLLNSTEQQSIKASLEALLQNPELPKYEPRRARDNIFVRLSNPLTIGQETPGFRLVSKDFYDWNGLPPILRGNHSDIATRLTDHFEFDNSDDWRGHFMAGAFLAQFERLGKTPENDRE